MEQAVQTGANRTGIATSPKHSKEMIKNAQSLTHPHPANGTTIETIQLEYIREAEPIGSVPLPTTVKGALSTAVEKIAGRNPAMLINKLGERLAFERSGVRLYDAFITKCEAAADPSPVELDRVREFREEEARHFEMLSDAMKSLGADPTAQTPAADVAGVAAMGVQKVMSDPRTTVGQCLEALLTAELTDHAGWSVLIRLADEMGLDKLSEEFSEALETEEEHLEQVRQWAQSAVMAEAKGA